MARLPRFAPLLAALAGAAALVFLLWAGPPGAEPVTELAPDAARSEQPARRLESEPIPGGVYAGVVVDGDDRPLHGARVMLVAYGTGATSLLRSTQSDANPEIPEVGDYRPGGEAITDEDGRFRIAADSQSHITRVLAYHTGHFLDVVEVKGPRADLRLQLQRAGRVVGTVVDDGTGRPVAGALVDIYLQQRVAPVPDLPNDARYPLIKRPQFDVSWLATLGRFIPKVLGPRIYGLVDEGTETLRLRTDANGHFELGPLGNAVQIEFVITHPAYKWMDFDTDDGKKTPRRTVVEPGETVEREFRLRKGGFIAGQVVDDTGQGVPDVLVKVQAVTGYYKHWWYTHKDRRVRTDDKGRFRVEGLSIGSQQLILQHPSFGVKYETAEPGTEDLVVVADRLGGLQGTLAGLPAGRGGRKIILNLEATEQNPRGSRHQQEQAVLDANNEFVVSRILPGTYEAWVRAGKSSSQPVLVTIDPMGVTRAAFELGGGGTIQVRLADEEGGVVDPASARLIRVQAEGDRALGHFVSRGGELDVDGVAAGRYRLLVQGQGRIPVTTEPFEVSAARVVRLPPIVLRRWGYLRFGTPVDERGRPAPLTDDFRLEVRVGEGPWQPVINASADMPVEPGPVAVRARDGDLRFEAEYDVPGGAPLSVRIVLAPGG